MLHRKKIKTYPHHQSPFFRLSSRKKAASLLKADIKTLERLGRTLSSHTVFTVNRDGKERLIEHPTRRLDLVHKTILRLLSKIETPEYLHSGKKRTSYVANARTHVGKLAVQTMDIQNFYPSASRGKVFRFFEQVMQCPPDVSGLLANLCTFGGHLPTGSRLSTLLSYFVNQEMFDRIHEYCKARGWDFTLYVDDLTISGAFKRSDMLPIKMEIRKSGFRSNRSKERFYSGAAPKLVTGVILSKGEMKVPNVRHQAIHETFQALNEAQSVPEREKLLRTLIGRLSEAGQIEVRFRSLVRHTIAEREKLLSLSARNPA